MSISTIEEISKWQLEAKNENNTRYFYHTSDVSSLENGSKSYVIGRKGTGKTAIARFLKTIKKHDVFTADLSFQNFPFSELYNCPSTQYKRQSQYIPIWKYIIYSCICRLMTQNEQINSSARSKIEKAFGRQKIHDLKRLVTSIKSASINILGCGGDIEVDQKANNTGLNWDEKSDILEEFILDNIDNSTYYIVFDELDEDYTDARSENFNEQYGYLITSLFKAVQHIRSIFSDNGTHIRPVVFIREDIFDLLTDSDRTKWTDLQITLDWDTTKLQNLLAFRISRAIKADGVTLDFNKALGQIFQKPEIHIGHRKEKIVAVFDYIKRSTLYRPRDFIKYLLCCSKISYEKTNRYITPQTLKEADKQFSIHLKSEFEDEIRPLMHNISDIFIIFSRIGKQTLSVTDFINEYTKEYQGNANQPDPDYVLKHLFSFGIIGNVLSQPTAAPIFRYEHKQAWFNKEHKITIHRGLFKSLQIV